MGYAGAEPLVVVSQVPEYRYQQTGRALGLGVFIKPPYPMYPDALARPVEVVFRRINDVERETTWRYEFVSATPLLLQGDELDLPSPVEIWDGGWAIGTEPPPEAP